MLKFSFSTLFFGSLVILTGCGGSSEQSGITTPNPTIEPTIEPTTVPTIAPAPTPTAFPLPAPTQTPDVISQNDRPELFAEVFDGDQFLLEWTDMQADRYRIIYWSETQQTTIHFSNENFFVTPPIAEPGRYTLIVEAYDELGNSYFSEPVFMEYN